MKSGILGLATLVAVVLGTLTLAAPANAATVNPAPVTVNLHNTGIVAPNSVGAVLCVDRMCVQRITSVSNNAAYVEIWANNRPLSGHFELRGPDGHYANSLAKTWQAHGAGWIDEIPRNQWTANAWDDSTGTAILVGQIKFGF